MLSSTRDPDSWVDIGRAFVWQDPALFLDDDGQVYLFFQGKSTLKGDYSLSCAKVNFVD